MDEPVVPGTEVADQNPQPAAEPTSSPNESNPETSDPTPESTSETAQETSTDWRDSISDENVKKFAEQFTSPADAAKAALEFRRKLSNAIHVPSEGAEEEDVAKFRKAIGVPESPDDYEVTIPEGLDEQFAPANDEKMKEFINGMWEAGASQDVLGAATNWYYNFLLDTQKETEKRFAESIEAATSTLRKEWGDEFDRNVEGASRVFKMFGDENSEQILADSTYEGVPIGNHPVLLRMFASIWKRVGEDGFRAVMSDEEKQTTEEKLNQLTQQAHDARAKGNIDEAERLFKERTALSQKYYNNP